MRFASVFAWVLCSCGGSVPPGAWGIDLANLVPPASDAAPLVSDAGASIDARYANDAGSVPGAPQVTILASENALIEAPLTQSGNHNTTTISWNATNATTCTASGAWGGTQATSGKMTTAALAYSTTGNNTYTYSLSCTGSQGTTSASTVVTVYATGSAPTLVNNCGGTSANAAWVYHDGVFVWPGDFTDDNTTIDYKDTTSPALTGPYDVAVNVTGAKYAYWLPYSENWDFYVTGCNYLTFSLKAKSDNANWQVYFVMVGDVTSAKNVDNTTSSTNMLMIGSGANTSTSTATKQTTTIPAYGPTTSKAGTWSTFKIPLTTFFTGEVPASIYKFGIQNQTGSTDDWYLDEVGFTGK